MSGEFFSNGKKIADAELGLEARTPAAASTRGPASNGSAVGDQHEIDELLRPPPSAVAAKLKRLKSATFKAAQTRERLPHPLFWSLFLTEVSELRKKKEEKRLMDRLVLGVGSE